MDDGERDPAPAPEVEEETGRRPGGLEHLLTFQRSAGSSDAARHVDGARFAESTCGPVDITEADEFGIPLSDAYSMVKTSEIVGSAFDHRPPRTHRREGARPRGS
ncbi:MAG: hypothetical protein LBJ87_00880 [bacterium]|nr:hypothetical protein [bacterium]